MDATNAMDVDQTRMVTWLPMVCKKSSDILIRALHRPIIILIQELCMRTP